MPLLTRFDLDCAHRARRAAEPEDGGLPRLSQASGCRAGPCLCLWHTQRCTCLQPAAVCPGLECSCIAPLVARCQVPSRVWKANAGPLSSLAVLASLTAPCCTTKLWLPGQAAHAWQCRNVRTAARGTPTGQRPTPPLLLHLPRRCACRGRCERGSACKYSHSTALLANAASSSLRASTQAVSPFGRDFGPDGLPLGLLDAPLISLPGNSTPMSGTSNPLPCQPLFGSLGMGVVPPPPPPPALSTSPHIAPPVPFL